jgi:DNA-binding beta-propeller fold protein YncE
MMCVLDENNDQLIVSDHERIAFFSLSPPYFLNGCIAGDGANYYLGMIFGPTANSLIAIDHTNGWIDSFTSLNGSYLLKTRYRNVPLLFPVSIVRDNSDRFWVTERDSNRVNVFNQDFVHLFSVGSIGIGHSQLRSPIGIAHDPIQHRIYVSDTGNRRIQVICTKTNSFLFSFGKFGNDSLISPRGIAVDFFGNVWTADYSRHRVIAFNSSGEYITTLQNDTSDNSQFQFPYDVTVDPRNGRLFVVDSINRSIHMFSPLSPIKWNHSDYNRYTPAFRAMVFELMALHCIAEQLAKEAFEQGSVSDIQHCKNIMAFANLPRELLAVLFNFLLVLR